MHKNVKYVLLFSSLFLFFSSFHQPAHASTFDDFVHSVKNTLENGIEKVKDVFKKDDNIKNNTLSVESSITIAPGGDENRNNTIDNGDMIRFSYTITNTTPQDIKFGTFKTNIQKDKVNFVHNLYGVSGLDYVDNSIVFPNFKLKAGATGTIRFDARVNYDVQDIDLSTEPEILDLASKSLVKSDKINVHSNKLIKEEITKKIKKDGIIKQKEIEGSSSRELVPKKEE